MPQSRILIASSERTGLLAERLRDQLNTNYSAAELWKDVIRSSTAETTIETLERATEKYDFAVIVLDETDAEGGREAEPRKERDNRLFEAGIFIAALGRERCFIINNAERPYLPPDLDGIKSMRFSEPEPDKLEDREAWGAAIMGVASQILDRVDAVQRENKPKGRPLSVETLLDREKHNTKGGELEESNIVVTVTQPLDILYTVARQVRVNMDDGIGYAYYFHGDTTRVTRICQLLQMVLVAPMLADEREAEFKYRLRKLMEKEVQAQIIKDLEFICAGQLLKIYLLPNPPELQYVIHNATSETDSILYLKHKGTFVEWERGVQAYKLWGEMRKSLGICTVPSNVVFCGAPGFDVKKGDFYTTLKSEMKRFFPGIDEQVVKLCCEGSA